MKPFLFVLGVVTLFLVSCSTNKMLTEANQSLEKGHYYDAIEKYKLAGQKEKNPQQKAGIARSMADGYMGMGSYVQASSWYKNATRKETVTDVQLRYADALRSCEKLDEAEKIYEGLNKTAANNLKLKNGIESLKLVRQWKKLPPIYLIDNLKAVNTTGDEVSVAIVPGKTNTILYSSSSDNTLGKDISPVTGKKLADFFVSQYDSIKQKWSFPKLIGDSLAINSEGNESGICISRDGKLLIFSRAEYFRGQKLTDRLYFCKNENKKWSTPVLIGFSNDGSRYFDPALSYNSNTLYFASDRAGGKGQTDIWKSEINGDTFGEPVNMGEQINTPGREVSPFMRKNGHFYFSSDYHPGAGGLDIFHATVDLNGKWTVENMSTPVNSPDDDFGVVYRDKGESGYFSSSSKGSKAIDLYSFYSPPRLFQCFGKVCNHETDSIIPNVNVRVVGTDGSSILMKTNNGEFQVDLKPETDYAIMVFKQGYLNAQAKLSTRGLREAFEFKLDFKQMPTNQPIKIDNINYEFGKWDLLPEARVSLDKLVEILAINPEISVEIMSHTDDKGEDAFNQELSQKRADEVVRYLSQKGVSANKLKAKGYGESLPLRVNRVTANKYNFLKEGQVLNSKLIELLGAESQKDIARGLNRRTEFRVLERQ